MYLLYLPEYFQIKYLFAHISFNEKLGPKNVGIHLEFDILHLV